MKWENLKRGVCPKCGRPLFSNDFSQTYACPFGSCTFRISKARFCEIINDMNTPKPRMTITEDNSYGLNNLGHKKISKDFSDSNYLDY